VEEVAAGPLPFPAESVGMIEGLASMRTGLVDVAARPFYLSSNTGTTSTVAVSLMEEPSSPVQESVYVVCCVIGAEGCEPANAKAGASNKKKERPKMLS
jgi:hypothetical protein